MKQTQNILRIILFSAICLAGAAAQAHPGHNPLDHGLQHIVQSPYHLIVLASLGALCTLASQFVRKPQLARALTVAGTGCLLVAAAVWAVSGS